MIFKNNKPKYMLVDLDVSPMIDMTDDEKIDVVAARILKSISPLDPNRDPKAERSGKHRRGAADGIIRPSPAVFVGYMVWLMTLPMVSAAERFIPSVAWV